MHELLARGTPVVAPGAYDALSARLIEQAGFAAVYMTGFGASASLLGRPDLNVVRTIREYEAAGVAALHIEDQVAPKRCGHMAGKQVIPASEMVEKVRAAVEARRGNLLVIARTDARAVEGLDAALDRARAYRDAGADALFVEAPADEREIEVIADAFPDTPLVFNAVDGGRTPPLPLDRLGELGFSLVLRPVATLFAAARAVQEMLRADETTMRFDEFTDLIGLPELQALEDRFHDAT